MCLFWTDCHDEPDDDRKWPEGSESGGYSSGIGWEDTVPEGTADLYMDVQVDAAVGDKQDAKVQIYPEQAPNETITIGASENGLGRDLMENPISLDRYAGQEVRVMLEVNGIVISGHAPTLYTDSDGDGIYDTAEDKEWTLPTGETFSPDPNKPDSDGSRNTSRNRAIGLPDAATYL